MPELRGAAEEWRRRGMKIPRRTRFVLWLAERTVGKEESDLMVLETMSQLERKKARREGREPDLDRVHAAWSLHLELRGRKNGGN